MTRRYAIAALYTKDKRILLQERDSHAPGGAAYGFFGGGIEEGETPTQALLRELHEELEYRPSTYELFVELSFKDEYRDIQEFVFACQLPEPLPQFHQHEGVGRKLFTLRDARRLSMVGNDLLVLDRIAWKLHGKGLMQL